MKNLMVLRVFLLVALSMALAVGLVACGDDDSSNDPALVATWDLLTYDGGGLPQGFSVTITFNASTYQVTQIEGSETCIEDGVWSSSGSTLVVTATSAPCEPELVGVPETMSYTISGTTLTITNGEGEVLVFDKSS
jgi:hypothetical protein